jgi:hypothetical protein
MKSVFASVLFALVLSGCAGAYQMPVPMNTTYNLDGTTAANHRSTKIKRVHRSSYASVETTGSIGGEATEEELYAQLGKLNANTPEWHEVRKKIESSRAEQFARERQQLMICKNC